MNRNPQAPRPSKAKVEAAVAAVSAATGISPAVIRSDTRALPVINARWAVWRDLHEVQGFGFSPIARVWGCNHASIINARNNGWEATMKRPNAHLIGPAIARAL